MYNVSAGVSVRFGTVAASSDDDSSTEEKSRGKSATSGDDSASDDSNESKESDSEQLGDEDTDSQASQPEAEMTQIRRESNVSTASSRSGSASRSATTRSGTTLKSATTRSGSATTRSDSATTRATDYTESRPQTEQSGNLSRGQTELDDVSEAESESGSKVSTDSMASLESADVGNIRVGVALKGAHNDKLFYRNCVGIPREIPSHPQVDNQINLLQIMIHTVLVL